MDDITTMLGKVRSEIIEHGTELWGRSLDTGKELATRVHGGARDLSTVLRQRYDELGDRGRRVLEGERVGRLRTGAIELVEKLRTTATKPRTTTTASESAPAGTSAPAPEHDA